MEYKNLKEMLAKIDSDYSSKTAFRIKTSCEGFDEITFSTFVAEINALGTFLTNLGLKDKHIAVLGENRYEWIVAYLSVICGTGVVVPIDRDLPDESIVNLLSAGDVSAVIYSGTYEDIIKSASLPMLKHCISFDKTENDDEKYLSYKKSLDEGKSLLKAGNTTFTDALINDEKLASIMFTSGTTGFSKGVMLSHKNLSSNIFAATSFEKYRENEIMLSVLPYHHSFEFTIGLMASLTYGATICINDSLKYFAQNMILFKPTAMFLVPAIIYGMYRRIQETEKKLGRQLTKEEGAGAFGGRLSRIFSGSAPLKPELIKIFKNYGIHLCQGYGLTETSPVVATTKYSLLNDENIKSVGQIIPGCTVKIVDGEIWVKGDNVMLGYYKNQEATAEVFDGEWFKTGDLGLFDKENFLYIIGRKKNVIIASGGENVYPEEIEQLLFGIPHIADGLIYGGDSDTEDTVTAVIYPNYDLLAEKTDEEIKTIIKDSIAEVNEKLPVYKHILTIKIRTTPFEKTTSNKIKRNKENTMEI